MKLHPVTQTTLLLVAVIFGTTVSTAATNLWLVFGGATVSGMAAGRIVRLVQRATA